MKALVETILRLKTVRLYLVFLIFLLSGFTGFSQVSTFTSNVATGNWNAPGSWTEVGSDVDNIPDADDIVIILTGHNISLNGAQSASSVTINLGGTLTANLGGLTVGTMVVNGTYIHAINGGAIPTATWASTSNCTITGVTSTTPGGFGQTFGNLTWNSSGQTSNIYLQSNITIQGDFSVLDTGLPLDPNNRALRMSNTATGYTINVGGNFILTNSSFKMNNSTGSCTMNVAGNFNLNSGNFIIVTGAANSSLSVVGDVNILSGTLDMQEDGSASTGTLNVTGNFTHTGGSITESSGGNGLIVFNKVGIQTFTSGGTINNNVDIVVNSGSILQMAAATTVVGGNNFTLSSGASIGIRSTAGITIAGATGNVQSTGTRSYATGANYIYNGSTNQSAGDGLPGTVSNLTIANTGGGGNNTVSLVSNTAITNAITITNGVFALGANNVTSVGSVNMTGTSITGTGTLTLAGDITTNASGTTASINAPIVLGASSRTFTIADGGANPDLQISTSISGAGGIIKAGLGLLNMFGANTYAGLTTINSGTLQTGSLSALGSTASGTIISTGAALNLGGIIHTANESLTVNGSGISGGGAIVNTSASPATFAGLLTLGSSCSIIANNGTITFSNAGTITGANFNLTLGGSTGGTISSIIGTGSGQVIKNGSGTWILAGSNTFTGGVTIDAGTLRLANSGALNSTTPNAVTFGSGSTGVLQLNGNSVTVSGLNTNATVGTPVVENNSAGTATLTINSPGVNTFAGTLQNGSAGTLAITKLGAGVLTLSATNTFSGGTTLASGTLNINNSSALGNVAGTITLNGGTIDNTTGGALTTLNYPQNWNSDFTFTGTQNLNLGAGNVTLGGNRQVTVNANTLTVGGVISAAAFNLTKEGAGVLSLGTNAVTLNSLAINSGTFTSTTGILSISGSFTNSGTFTNNGGTVNYNGSSQGIAPVTYSNLTIDQLTGFATLVNPVAISGILTLANGNLNLNGSNLTLGLSASISVASPSATRMIIATGGNQVIKAFSGVGSFVFPIGDNTGTSEYSPITVNVTAGSGFPSNIGVSVVDAKHPNNSSTTNFLTRYWEITQPGITGCVATITGTYSAADITGTEASIHAANLPGVFNQATNPWIKFSALAGNTLTATGAALSLGQTNTFTGITGADPTSTIVGGGVSICSGSSVNLTTNVTGDPAFTYSWSPAAGLSATNISNPIATPGVTTVYTVTSRDGNGIIDTDNTTITVNPATPAPTIGTSGSVVCDGINPDVTLTSSAAPNGGTYIWYKGGVATGDVGSSLIINDPAGSGLYTVEVIDGITLCVSPQSAGETVTINPTPLTTPAVTPATTTICSGNTVTVTVNPSQAGINYELFNGGTSLSSAVAGTGGAINLITSALTSNTTITVRATNPTTSCTILLSGTSVVTVTPIPATPTINPVGPLTVCEGTAAIVLTSSAGAGNQWYKDGSPIGGATATTLNITTSPANSGNYTVISTVSGCASLVSTAVSVTINATPLTTPVVTPATTTICSGNTVTVGVAGSQAGINYELFNGGTSLSSAVAGTGGAINLITTALTANTTITVRATNPTTTCTILLSGTSVVTVTPIPATPTIGPVGPVVACEGTAAVVLTSSAGAGNQWYRNGIAIGGATATTLNITTSPANSGSYTVISTVSGCASLVSTAVSVTINATPLTTPVVTPATTTVCSGSTVTVGVAGSQAGINYELFNGVTSLSSAVAGTGGAINLITSALTANTTITVRATNPVTSCTILLTGTSVVTVTAIPATPTIGPAGPLIVCEGTAAVVLTSSAGAGNQWYKDGSPIGGATATTLSITTSPANSGNYTVISTVSGCASIVSTAVSVTINALPLSSPVVSPATTTICSGNTVTVNVAGSQAGINYELFNGVTSLSSAVAGTGGAINLITSALTANTTITVRATNPVTSCTILLTGTSVVTVTAIPATPTIGPVGPVVVCEGTAAIVLTSTAGAGNQWYKDGSPIGGATATTLNITTAPGNSGSYTVISTVSGCASLVSTAVSITINPLPLTTPVVAPATTTICSGNTVTVTVNPSQAGINYELFNGGTSLSSAVAGTGGAINLITSTLTANTTITVRATNPTTSCTILLSGTSVVTVTPIPATPTIGPVGPVVACEGTAAVVLTSSAGAGNQWYRNGSPIGGATATTLNITTSPANSGSYTVISTVSGCASLVSTAVAVTINPTPLTTPVVAPATTTICSGNTVTVTVNPSQAGINYELFNGGTSLSSAVAGTGGAINLITSALTSNTTITVRATNPTTTCTILLSGTSVVTVTPIPATPTIGPVGPVVVCEGTAAIVLTSSAGVGNQWYRNGSPIGGATASTLNITTSPANSGSYTVISTVSGCASLVSTAVAVTINPTPLTTPVVAPATTTICSGNTVTVNVAGSQAGINYELFNGGTSLSSAVAGTGGAINLITTALTANTTITVRATNPTTTCTILLSGTSVVTVTPIPATPTINPVGPLTVCEGTAAIVLTSSAGVGNQWYRNGSPIGGATASTLNITTSPANSGSYTVISTVSGCASLVSTAVAVTINPTPLITPVVTPATPTICSGTTVTVTVNPSQAGINYELFNGGTSLSSAVAGTGGAINLITSALTANTTITVRATNPTTSCTILLSGTSVVTVTPIPATPTIGPVGPVVVCEGTAAIVLTSSAGAGNQWYKDGVLIGGATATTLNITTSPANSGNYTVISTVSSCASLVSTAVAVTINPTPLITPAVTPATPTICSGSTVTVGVAGSQAGINYELFNGVTSLSSAVAGTGGAINLITSALTANTTITVRATNPVTSCTILLSGTSVVTVTPIPATPTINPVGPLTVCEGTAAIVLTSTAGAGNQWYKDGLLIGGATATTLNITTSAANSGSYTVISTVSSCASLVSTAVSVTINPTPLITPAVSPATPTICSGNTVTVTVNPSQAGINYELFNGVTSLSSAVAGTGGAINLITSALTANTTITVLATNPTTSCTILLSGTSVVTVTPIPATPTIGPVGPVVACEGAAAIVLTSSAGAGNQWYKDGSPIGGATATILNITTSPANSGNYTVISTVSGCASLVSTAVSVTINALPLSSPGVSPANTTICSGNPVTVSVTGTETGINYQLFDGATPISPVVAGTGGIINLISATLTANTTITVAAINPVSGCSILLPATVTVTLSATIPTPTIIPAGPVTACIGDPAIILTSSAASGNQWYKDGVIIAGQTGVTLSISTGVINSGSYIVIETQAGCTSAVSVGVNVTVNSIASPPVAANPTPICVGGTIPTLTAIGTNINWYSDAALTTLVGTGSPFTPTVAEVDNTVAGTYTLYVTQTIGCESAPTPVDVLVNPAVSVNAGTDTDLCNGQSITLGGSPSATGGSGTYTYSWTSIPPGFTSAQSNPVVTPVLGITTYVLQVTDAFGCQGTGQVDIIVNEVPTFSVSNNTGGGTGQICSGSTINISLASPTVGATITLQNVNYGVVTGGAYATGGSFVTGSTITEPGGLFNGTNATVTINYIFSVSTPDCTNPVTQQTSVIVNPTPSMSAVNATTQICSNSAVNITLNSPTTGAIIQLTSVIYGGVTGTLVGGTTFTPGSKITETLINPLNASVTVRYNFDVIANGCTTTGFFEEVIVNPNPTFIASNFSTEICSGDQTNILFGSATPGHQINAVSVNYGFVTGGTVNPGVTIFNSATPLIETLFNNTNSAIDVVYEFNVTTPLTTPVCPLSPVSQFVTVRVNPNPTFVVTDNTGGGSGTICSGNQTNILLNTAVSGGQIRLKAVTYGAVTGTLTPGILFTNGQSIAEVLLNSTGSPVVVSYEFEAIIGSCGPSASQFVNVTVNPNPNVVALPASQTICSGAVTNIGLSTTNGVGGVTYTWTRVDVGVSGVLIGTGTTIAETLTASTPGTSTYTITPSAGGCNGTAITVIVTVNPLPNVVAAPASETICSGTTSNISLSTTNGVAGATYSWTVVQSNVSGATAGFGTSINQTLTATTSSAGTATYTITPSASGCTGTAIVVVVTVNPNPNVIALPASQTICSGAVTSIGLSTTNGVVGVTYNWTRVDSGVSGVLIGTGTTITEMLTATGSTPGTATYTITPSAGGCNGTAITVIVTVNPLPNVVAAPNAETICSGTTSNIALSTTNGVAGATYSWTVVQSNVSGATAGFGASINQTLTATTSSAGTATYTITPSASGCTGTAIVVVVTVNPNPNVVALPASQTICSGAVTNIGLSTTNGVGGVTYTWTRVDVGVSGVLIGTGTTIAETLTASTPGTSTYTITPSAGGCNGTAITVIVTVNPLPNVVAAPASETICSGTTSNISLSTTNGVAGATYSWTVVQSNVSGATAGFGTSINQTLTATTSSAGTATYTITPSASGCTGTAIVVVVTVNPNPNVVALPASQTICSGAVTSIGLSTTNGVVGVTYNWTRVDSGVSGVLIGTGTTITEMLTATGSTPGTATYTITPSAGGCNGTAITVIVTVNPLPNVVAAPASETICSGTTSNIALSTTNGVAGATYSWTVVQSNVSGATAGFGASINQTLTATTSSAGTATYTITPSASGCTGTAIVVVVTVNPNPNVVALPASQTICSGAVTNIGLSTTNGVGGVTYTWTRVDVGVSGVLIGTGTTIAEMLTATGSTAGTSTYTITPSAGGCNGTAITVIVTVNPLPNVVAAPASETICSGTTSNISLSTTNGVAGATYSWTVVQSNVSGATAGFGTSINQTLTATTSSAGTATYTITPSASGCTGTAIVVVVTVNPNPNVVALPASQTICSGAVTSIGLSTTNGVVGVTYNWTRVDSGVSGVLIGTGTTITEMLTATGSTPGTATYTITPSAGGCNGTAINVIVTVNPLPNVVAAPNAETICSGTTSNIALSTTNGVMGATYSWTVVQSNVSGATAGFGSSINQTITATTSLAGTATYTITPSAGGCTGTPIVVLVIVNPTPVITNTALQLLTTVCSGVALNFVPVSTTDPATTYSWITSTSGSTFTGITATGFGAITDTPVNTGSTIGFITYIITPQVSGCAGNPVNYVVTVLPVPTADGLDVTICSGQNAIININANPTNVSGTTFSWVVTASGNVLGASNGNGSLINQNLSLTTFSTGTVTYHITPAANGCNGPVRNIVVTINPLPTVDAGVDYQVCEPVTIPLSGNIGGAATSGTWIVVTGSGSISVSTVVGNVVTANYSVVPADISTTVVFRLQTNDPDLAGPCALASDLLNVQINRRPTVTVPADFVVCEPSNLLLSPISLSGTIGGSASTGLWSVVSGAGSLSASNLVGAIVSSQYTISPADVGTTITLRLTANDPDGPAGPCIEEFEEIIITINQAAVVSAGPDLQLCRDIPSILLQGAQSGAPTTVAWSGGLGTFSNATILQTDYFFNNPSEVTTTVVLTITALDPDGVGPCTSVADQMNLKINPLPVVVYSGLPLSLAENEPPVTLTGNQIGGIFTILPLTSNIGSTSQSPVDKTTFSPSAATLGLNTITYTYADGNGCTNKDIQTIIINPVTTVDWIVDFSAGARKISSSEWELCSNQTLPVKLIGDPLATGPDGVGVFTASPGAMYGNIMSIDKIGPDYFIQTSGLVSDRYLITYTFTNTLNAVSQKSYFVNMLVTPTAQIAPPTNSCISAAIDLNDSSTLPSINPFGGVLTNWNWSFGDGMNGTGVSTSHSYAVSATYSVSLNVFTNQGCSSSTILSVRVGDVPVVDFDWSAICNNDSTKFEDRTTKVVGSTPPGISVISAYTWDFGDGDILAPGIGSIPLGMHAGRTSGTYKDPKHKYVINGTYGAELIVDTNDGCTNSKAENVFILPYTTVVPIAGSEYMESFEINDGGWIKEAFEATNSTPGNIIPSQNSWMWESPAGTTINTTIGGSKAWWTKGAGTTYYSNENSVVNGPCFDLSQLKRPMVALDYFSDAEKNLDGAVLQYSVNGGITWRIVGPPEGQSNRDEGIDWFNATGILSNPGKQAIGQYGWTDKLLDWKNARFNLDMIPTANRSQVRIRIAFASNDGNDSQTSFDGYAFDNFFVGEKARNVLVEHFTTSTLNASVSADAYLNGLYQQQITDRGTSDFQDIQYHVSFSGTDPLNKDNPTDPAARALYFGASQPPYTIMDGILIPGKFTGVTNELNKVELDRRALVNPIFDLTLKDTTSSDNKKISVKMVITARQDFTSPLIMNVALIEKDVNGFKNVLRKNLFGSDGETINLTWVKGQKVIKLKFDVPIDVPISNPNQLMLVGYVQDKNTKEIYQSIAIAGPVKIGDPVVGIEDQTPALASLNSIQMFPNPANGEFTFGLPTTVYPSSQWAIIDQRGVTVLEGNFDITVNGMKQIDVSQVANAVYFVVLTGPEGVTVRKKLVVMNRN